ncbi:Uncharacterised protein [Vibrio cholerae]|nr:Uncharacterised protein [Vibrio cholerae]
MLRQLNFNRFDLFNRLTVDLFNVVAFGEGTNPQRKPKQGCRGINQHIRIVPTQLEPVVLVVVNFFHIVEQQTG